MKSTKTFKSFTIAFNQKSFTFAVPEKEQDNWWSDLVLKQEFDGVVVPASQVPYPLPAPWRVAAVLKNGELKTPGESGLSEQLVILTGGTGSEVEAAFYEADLRKTYGKVWLVGAGPGAPDLMTIRAFNVLLEADFILYDDLVDKNFIKQFSARLIYVGKRKNRHSKRQDEINHLLYALAVNGHQVVRLKGGDPLIFARAGEELEFLQKRFITVEIVPGITAAQACAASFNIPFTKRGISGSVSLASAHYSISKQSPGKFCDTQIYYMAASKLAELSADLISNGLPPTTPAAIIFNGSYYDEQLVQVPLQKLNELSLPSPVTVIIGKVVNENFSNKKFLSTAAEVITGGVNAKIVHYPLIEIVPLLTNLPAPEDFDALLFTDPISVRIYLKRYSLEGQTVIAFNKEVEKELQKSGIVADLQFWTFLPVELKNMMESQGLKSVLFLHGQHDQNFFKDYFFEGVFPFPIYRIQGKSQEPVDLSYFSGIIFTHTRAVEKFLNLYKKFPVDTLLFYTNNALKKELLLRQVNPLFVKKIKLSITI